MWNNCRKRFLAWHCQQNNKIPRKWNSWSWINPQTENFREFKEWCDENLKDKNQKIAGFCTGGVRCEKSTSWLKQCGYTNVYHLKGGIIGYFIETENKNNLWQGDCFVFDDRVIINEKLE